MAPGHDATDWRRSSPSDVAVARLDADPDVGDRLAGHQPHHATRAELLTRAGRTAEAIAAYDRAIELTTSTTERRFLQRRRDAISSQRA